MLKRIPLTTWFGFLCLCVLETESLDYYGSTDSILISRFLQSLAALFTIINILLSISSCICIFLQRNP